MRHSLCLPDLTKQDERLRLINFHNEIMEISFPCWVGKIQIQ